MTGRKTAHTVGKSSGLCASCRHAQIIQSSKGSVFILCGLSRTDPRFPKYPRLPVLACDGYERRSETVVRSNDG